MLVWCCEELQGQHNLVNPPFIYPTNIWTLRRWWILGFVVTCVFLYSNLWKATPYKARLFSAWCVSQAEFHPLQAASAEWEPCCHLHQWAHGLLLWTVLLLETGWSLLWCSAIGESEHWVLGMLLCYLAVFLKCELCRVRKMKEVQRAF